jgi:centrosomal protein CEP120
VGNNITSETFQDLLQPKFHPERASIRIRSSIQLLRTYFETLHPIEFRLLTGNEILGQAQIPLNKIVKPLQQKSGMDKIFDVLTEEFHLRLSPSKGNDKMKNNDDDENLQPIVKIEVKLSRETPISVHKINNDKQHRSRSNSANNHNSSTTIGDNDNR